jgi:hypothetical protein
VGGVVLVVATAGLAAPVTAVRPAEEQRALVADLRALVLSRTIGESGGDPVDAEEWVIRLAGLALALLVKHRPDQRGYCARCQPHRVGWRVWLPYRVRRHPCLVWKATRLFVAGDPATVWWHTLTLAKHPIDLATIREWFTSTTRDVDEQATDILPRFTDHR